MEKFLHSVILERDYCNGCTYCLDRCPTQAIRVREGKAEIITERCIDCGVCIKVCPYHAKGAQSDSLDLLKNFKFNVALPAISIYGQFGLEYDMNKVLNGLYELGFDYVFDVAHAADLLTQFQKNLLEKGHYPKPLISVYCPAVIRLIQIRYPTLIDHISRLESPSEIAARIARKKIHEMTGLAQEDIGVFYLTECPARITSIRKPIGIETSQINGAISLEAVYTKLLRMYDDIEVKSTISHCSGKGVGWGMVGGQSYAMGTEDYLAVDGIDEVIKVLEQIELGKLNDIDFFEGYACVTGCVGGPLNAENPFIAKTRLRRLSAKYSQEVSLEMFSDITEDMLEWDQEIEPLPVMKLDTDFKQALEKLSRIEALFHVLPGIDCGACGSPTCRALAEDIVMGRATFEECVVRKKPMKSDENKR
jgi:iron only hydrogenase large subunit-like protein